LVAEKTNGVQEEGAEKRRGEGERNLIELSRGGGGLGREEGNFFFRRNLNGKGGAARKKEERRGGFLFPKGKPCAFSRMVKCVALKEKKRLHGLGKGKGGKRKNSEKKGREGEVTCTVALNPGGTCLLKKKREGRHASVQKSASFLKGEGKGNRHGLFS